MYAMGGSCKVETSGRERGICVPSQSHRRIQTGVLEHYQVYYMQVLHTVLCIPVIAHVGCFINIQYLVVCKGVRVITVFGCSPCSCHALACVY